MEHQSVQLGLLSFLKLNIHSKKNSSALKVEHCLN